MTQQIHRLGKAKKSEVFSLGPTVDDSQSLKVKTFSNIEGGNGVFKALSHPLAARAAEKLLAKLATSGPVAVYDPLGQLSDFAAFYSLASVNIGDVFVQNVKDVGKPVLGCVTRPVTELDSAAARTVFIAAFDHARLLDHVRHLLPEGAAVASLDDMRLPEAMLTNKRNYTDTLNFATNFALFRDTDGEHTRVVTANYWANYGGKNAKLWCSLMAENGDVLAEWTEQLGDTQHLITLDSKAIRARFKLPEFTGSLFMHAVGAAGHDIVKYALDTYGDEGSVLSCTHDANSWPADLYAGIPAPREGERVVLWVENSSPHAIPANAIGLGLMGGRDVVHANDEIAPFASTTIDVGEWLPDARWPQQLELHAGRYFVRPRYEVIAANGRKRIAHANVERTDLTPDEQLKDLPLMGKGFLLPAPILPLADFTSVALPTPMSTAQANLPLALLVYDASGEEVLRHPLGCLKRSDSVAIDLGQLLQRYGKMGLPSGYGHMELVYDFENGGSADGWMHGLFRYEHTASGHGAETSFGAHMFNTALVYKNEPQSYAGKAPGLSTRLFLRLGDGELDTLCHLVYPVSTDWHETSQTDLILHNEKGEEVARTRVNIPKSGSLHWRYRETFTAEQRKRAGERAYVIIRDVTCRLFGYHGLIRDGKAFSLDHMFGF